MRYARSSIWLASTILGAATFFRVFFSPIQILLNLPLVCVPYQIWLTSTWGKGNENDCVQQEHQSKFFKLSCTVNQINNKGQGNSISISIRGILLIKLWPRSRRNDWQSAASCAMSPHERKSERSLCRKVIITFILENACSSSIS